MNSWARNMDKLLKSHDSSLFIQETKVGRYDVYRKSSLGCELPNFVFSLTDSWQPQGTPIEYGICVILDRIKAIDLWRDDQFVENWIKDHEKKVESKERARKNNIESFLYDFRSSFAKATSGINTSSLSKIDKRKIREENYGNR